jgi:histidinol-phosphatase
VFLMAGPWDLAAPSLIVEEAGGRFTDLRGRNDLTSGTAVFTNGRLHDDVLRLVEPVVRKSGTPTA